MGCCNCEQKVSISFSSPLKIMMVDEEEQGFASLTVSYAGFNITAKGDVMYTLPVGMQAKMQVSYTDAAGNPAQVDGDVEWDSSNAAVLKVDVDPTDSTICTVTPLGPLGQAQVTATADADLGTGSREIVTVADISIVAGEAVAGSISPVGEPTPIPPEQRDAKK
jgi:hypothetical protein